MGWFTKTFRSGTKGNANSGIDFTTVDVKSYTQKNGFQGATKAPTRQEAMEYVPFARCIDLISKQSADIIVNGVRVVDSMGKEVTSKKAKRAKRLLTYSPDGYQSSKAFLRDIISDYLVEGNALVAVQMSGGNHPMPVGLMRLNSVNAAVYIGDERMGLGGIVYQAQPYGFSIEQTFPARLVAHAKFIPHSSDYVSDSRRQWFSESPLSMLRNAIYIGKAADRWVGDFFDSAAKNNLAIMLPDTMGADQMELQIKAYNDILTNSRAPLYLHAGATAQEINTSPQDADALKLREYGVQEIGRFYGVPAPLIGLHVTQWGSGIEQLARLHYRFGLRPHLSTVLDALSFRLLDEGQRFDVDVTHELRGDTAALTAFANAMRPANNYPGITSREELRDLIGLSGEFKDDWGWSGNAPKGVAKEDDMGYNPPDDNDEDGGSSND